MVSKPLKMNQLSAVIRNCIQSGNYRDTRHASERKSERKISLPEILHVLLTGRHEKSKDFFETVFNTWNYAIRGLTIDGLDLRVIVSFEGARGLLIITTFYIEQRNKNGKTKN